MAVRRGEGGVDPDLASLALVDAGWHCQGSPGMRTPRVDRSRENLLFDQIAERCSRHLGRESGSGERAEFAQDAREGLYLVLGKCGEAELELGEASQDRV
jgi:hypothetical protein